MATLPQTPEAQQAFEAAWRRWLADGHPMAMLYPAWMEPWMPGLFGPPPKVQIATGDHAELLRSNAVGPIDDSGDCEL